MKKYYFLICALTIITYSVSAGTPSWYNKFDVGDIYVDSRCLEHTIIDNSNGIVIEKITDGSSTWFHVIAAIGTLMLPEGVEAICNRTVGDPKVCGVVYDVTAALVSIKGVKIFKSMTKGIGWIANRGRFRSTATIETGIFETAQNVKTVFETYQKIGCVNWDDVEESNTKSNIPICNIPKISVRSSSYLKPSTFNTYYPENLLDGEATTPWVESGEGQGIGEWVQFDFSTEANVSSLMIINGYNYLNSDRVGDRFFKNSRVKTAVIEFSNGEKKNIKLDDTNRYQSFHFNSVKTSFVRITIGSVYPGSKWMDTCLSEVNITFS